MARLNIEDCWWTDPRRSALIRLVGDEERADGCAMRAWRIAQEFWKNSRGRVPKKLFDVIQGADELVRVGLADVQDSFVYVRGSSAYLDWVAEKREQAKAAGQRSAQVRRERLGTAQPNATKSRTNPERPSNEPRTKLNDVEPSGSSSSSCSGSNTENKESIGADVFKTPTQTGTGLETKNLNQLAKGKVAEKAEALQKANQFVGAYVKAYQTRYAGRRPEDLNDGKVRGQIVNWIAAYPLARACDLIQVYFQMDAKWFETKGYDFLTFRNNLNKVGQALDTGKDPDGKTVDFVAMLKGTA